MLVKRIIISIAIVISGASLFAVATPTPAYAQSCAGRLLTFPTWYAGLPGAESCKPRVSNAGHIWIIVLNILEVLLQLAGYLSAFYVLWGGIQYMMSIGEPQRIASAKATITNALIGLVIAMLSVAIVALVGRAIA